MKQLLFFYKQRLFTFFCILTLSLNSCSPLIALFDQHAYEQTTSIKVDALNLMDLASENYNTHETKVKEFKTQFDKLYEYERNRPKNTIILKMWDLMRNEDGNLLYGFIKRWKTDGTLNENFIKEAKKIVGTNFDKISGLQSKLIKKEN